jgi:hypothetical protein
MARTRGNIPAYVVKSLRRDRHGIFAGSVEVYKEVDESAPRINLGWLRPQSAPQPFGLPVVSSNGQMGLNGLFVITFDYEGIDAQAQPSPQDEVTFELDTTMSEDPIETHPRFTQLKARYGWDQDNRRFAEMISGTGQGATALSSGGKQKQSPLFGTDSWLVVGALFRKTYASKVYPTDLLQGIGTITKAPPGIGQFKLPPLGKSRNWLKLAPKVKLRGNCLEISEEWMMSGPKGWVEDVYSQGQLG